jgi:membrane dipeptidase
MGASDRLVIEGLICHCDGNPEPLRSGCVTAANVTVVNYHAALEGAFDEMSKWVRIASACDSGWHIIRRAADFKAARDSGKVGLIMGWQNALPMGSNLDRIDGFHAMGLRVVQLSYNEANQVGDGCHEPRNGGLTKYGREVVRRMNDVGIAIDVSHCSEATATEAAKASSKPVLLTHANAKAINDRVRNKLDDTMRAVADSGGVIGVSLHGFLNWSGNPAEPPSLDNFVRHMRHIADLVGAEHVGIGTDLPCIQSDAAMRAILDMSVANYSGAVDDYIKAFGNDLGRRYPSDVPTPRQFPVLLDALKRSGFTQEEVDGIAGNNFARAFAECWR